MKSPAHFPVLANGLGPHTTSTPARRVWRWALAGLAVGAAGGLLATPIAHGGGPGPRDDVFNAPNATGRAQTINVSGFPVLAVDNPFFQDLGANGRRCITCHQPAQNMTVTPAGLRARFDATDGTDPIFRPNDGSNSPLADVSTVQARRAAYSMLLTKGLIRVGLAIPASAEFALAGVADPYGYAGNNANGNELSLFRRPLPTTNLGFLSTVMWDGRETLEKGSAAAIHFDLADQANSATQGHAQAPAPLDEATRQEIVAYETGLFTCQVVDAQAGRLRDREAYGGPEALSRRLAVPGANDPLGCAPDGSGCTGLNPLFDPVVFTEFAVWTDRRGSAQNAARAAIARGQALFNTLPIPITGVSGINDDFGVPLVMGTCTTCHDMPHAGNHSVPAPLDIGVADPPVSVADGGDGVHNRSGLAVGDMPVYTLRNIATGDIKVVTDPGRALVTGRWKDVGRIKGPVLRGLAGRAPYFHNGSAAGLDDVVNFYDTRFNLGLTDAQKADLEAFLRAL